MFVYIIMLILAVAFSLLAEKFSKTVKVSAQGEINLIKKREPNTFFVWVVFLTIAFVAAFRYNVGMDFWAYYETKNWTIKFENESYNSLGFTIFSIICSWIFGGIDASITIGAAIVTIFIFIFTVKKNAENFTLSVILFILTGVFTGMLNGVRQYLATAILFAGYNLIIERKPIKWLLVVLLASTFHVTAILMFLVYFICNLKCDWKLVFLYFSIAVVMLFAYEPLFDLIGALKQEEIDMSESYMTGSVSLFRVAVQCVPIIFLIFAKKSDINTDEEARFLFNICLLNAAIAVAAMNSPYLSRFWIYTSCFQVLMYPKILSKIKKKERGIITTFMIFFYLMFWAYEILNTKVLSEFYWIFKYLK